MDDRHRRLADRAYEPLPIGAIEPRGWLRRQLRIQADGLTGHLDEFWPDLADNQWLGGERGGWERGPYFADGLVPLAFLLDDPDLIDKAETWVEGFLDWQEADGWIGPKRQASDQGHEYDPWPRFVVLKVLRQYYEATEEDRAIDAMSSFCRWLADALANEELVRWGHYRWADLAVSIVWLYDRTGDDQLLDVAEMAAEKGYDWGGHFLNFEDYADPYEKQEGVQDLSAHVVNNAMGIKAPGIRYLLEGDGLNAASDAIALLDRYHGQATGLFTGDEFYGGKSPTRGTELCAVVEYMYSLEQLAVMFGAPEYGDRLERITFNALMATFTPDMRAHQYDQQANQVLCAVDEKGWINGPDANVFGLEPNFGCCTANMHQGWPKFASHLWMRDEDELAVVAYAPCAVTTDVDGTSVTILEETNYPFRDVVSMTVEVDGTAEFALSLRIPDWIDQAEIELPGGDVRTVGSGPDYCTIERTWSDGETVEVAFSTPVRSERRYRGAVTLHRGPLVFSLPIDADWKRAGGEPPHADWELYPDSSWNYGLEVDPDDLQSSVSVAFDPVEDRPFSPDGAPVKMNVPGQLLPEWGLDDEYGWAAPIPNAIVKSKSDSEELSLVPYGCTNLRVTEFPLVS